MEPAYFRLSCQESQCDGSNPGDNDSALDTIRYPCLSFRPMEVSKLCDGGALAEDHHQRQKDASDVFLSTV